MPVSLIQATAEEAADNFRQEIGAVLSGLASALGTPAQPGRAQFTAICPQPVPTGSVGQSSFPGGF